MAIRCVGGPCHNEFVLMSFENPLRHLQVVDPPPSALRWSPVLDMRDEYFTTTWYVLRRCLTGRKTEFFEYTHESMTDKQYDETFRGLAADILNEGERP